MDARHTRGAYLSAGMAYTELAKLEVELVKLQHSIKNEGLQVAVIFEGCGSAGKGNANR